MISSSLAVFPDTMRLCAKLAVLCVFSLPLIYIANLKTGIITDLANFLRKGNLRHETGDVRPVSDRS